MVATTTTMHSVTGMKSMMTCLAPYNRVSSDISSASSSPSSLASEDGEGRGPSPMLPTGRRLAPLEVRGRWTQITQTDQFIFGITQRA